MIPNIAHFIWFGRDLPWIYGLALRSAAVRGGFDRVVLHSSDNIEHTAGWALVQNLADVVNQPLRPESLIGKLDPEYGGLWPLYQKLRQPAARANLIRAVVLALEGGVYLDTDTVTLASFSRCLNSGVFCGREHIVLPHKVMVSRNPAAWLKAGVLLAARDLMRRMREGYKTFRAVERFYAQVVNNAVLGSEPGHPFMLELLGRMLDMPPREQLVRFALGTHLLEKMVDDYRGEGLTLHPPRHFYPLAPEISEHWFRIHRPCTLDDVVTPDTISVHWYASVRTKKLIPQIDESYIKRHAKEQLFSALALPFVD